MSEVNVGKRGAGGRELGAQGGGQQRAVADQG